MLSQLKQFIHNHIVAITGENTASDTGLLLALYGVQAGSFYVAEKYLEDYERDDGTWQFKKIVLVLYFTVPLNADWAGASWRRPR
jgi:hypothetical protein